MAISVISLKPFPIPASVSCSVHASNVLRHAERMHALSSCVWNGEEKKRGKKKNRGASTSTTNSITNSITGRMAAQTSLIRERASVMRSKILRARSYFCILSLRGYEFLVQLFYYRLNSLKKRNTIIACISCKIISITIQFEVTLQKG